MLKPQPIFRPMPLLDSNTTYPDNCHLRADCSNSAVLYRSWPLLVESSSLGCILKVGPFSRIWRLFQLSPLTITQRLIHLSSEPSARRSIATTYPAFVSPHRRIQTMIAASFLQDKTLIRTPHDPRTHCTYPAHSIHAHIVRVSSTSRPVHHFVFQHIECCASGNPTVKLAPFARTD